jgi:lipid-A-disaccharide synthase
MLACWLPGSRRGSLCAFCALCALGALVYGLAGPLPRGMAAAARVWLCALEASGDAIGARAMAELRRRAGPGVRFAGVGGPRMCAQGLEGGSVFEAAEGAVMGTTEVLSALPWLALRLREARGAALAFDPHVVLTVDAKGFNLRLQRALGLAWEAQRGGPRRRLHLVPPSGWAFHSSLLGGAPGPPPRRALGVDEALALLPFEPAYLSSECSFVGHPVLEETLCAGSFAPAEAARALAPRLREHQGRLAALEHPPSPHEFVRCNVLPGWARLPPPAPRRAAAAHGAGVKHLVVGLFPGSRRAEVQDALALLPALAAALPGHAELLVSSVEGTRAQVERALAALGLPRVAHVPDKAAIVASCDVAAAVSGTVVSELVLLGVPTVVFYRGSRLTQWLASRLARVRFVSLSNILADEELLPEHLFAGCRADAIAASVVRAAPGGCEQAHARQRQARDLLAYLACWDERSQRPVAPSQLLAERLLANLAEVGPSGRERPC